MPIDGERPLIECVTRQGYFNLPVSYIKLVLTYLGKDSRACTLRDVLLDAIDVSIPEPAVDLIIKILTRRKVWHEQCQAHDPVVEMEWVLECFDKEERATLEAELNNSKQQKKSHADFASELREYKVTVGNEKHW